MPAATTTTQAQLTASAQATAGTPAHALYAPSVAAANIPNPFTIASQAAAAASQAAAAALNPVSQIEGFLVQQVNWQRISKVILGLVLVSIGAVGLTYTGVFKPTSRALFGGLRKVDEAVEPWAIRYGK